MVFRFISFFRLKDWPRLITFLLEAKPYDQINWNVFLTKKPSYLKITTSGRQALSLILKSLDLPNGAHIGVQPYNCISVFQTVHSMGYKMRFIDIKNDLTMDPHDLKSKMKGLNALILTHTLGSMASIQEILALDLKIPIIEDCAHGFRIPVGDFFSGSFGDFSFFSFGNGKLPAFGKGGLLVCNSEYYLDKLLGLERELSKVGISQGIKDWFRILKSIVFYNWLNFPWLYFLKKRVKKTSNLFFEKKQSDKYGSEVSLFLRKLIAKSISQSINILEIQKHNFSTLSNMLAQEVTFSSGIPSNGFFFVILEEDRDQLFEFLLRNGIECGRHFNESIDWVKLFGYKHGDCLNFENVVSKVLAIPCHYSLTSAQIQKTGELINEWYREKDEKKYLY
jgi:perosamine synthetase